MGWERERVEIDKRGCERERVGSLEGERVGIDKRGVGEGESGELGGGESGDRVEELGGREREWR